MPRFVRKPDVIEAVSAYELIEKFKAGSNDIPEWITSNGCIYFSHGSIFEKHEYGHKEVTQYSWLVKGGLNGVMVFPGELFLDHYEIIDTGMEE